MCSGRIGESKSGSRGVVEKKGGRKGMGNIQMHTETKRCVLVSVRGKGGREFARGSRKVRNRRNDVQVSLDKEDCLGICEEKRMRMVVHRKKK